MDERDIVERARAHAAALFASEGKPAAAEYIVALCDALSIAQAELAAAKRHAGEAVSIERLTLAHSGMPFAAWKANDASEGHRVYRQHDAEQCYMCALLAKVDVVEAELAKLRARVVEVGKPLWKYRDVRSLSEPLTSALYALSNLVKEVESGT